MSDGNKTESQQVVSELRALLSLASITPDEVRRLAVLAGQAVNRIEQLEAAMKTFSEASWEFRSHIDKWGRITAGDVSGVSAAHHKALMEFDAALAVRPDAERSAINCNPVLDKQ